MFNGDSVADRVNKLCTDLIKQGLPDKALEVAAKFSELNSLVDREFQIITQIDFAPILDGSTKMFENVLKKRDTHRAALYEQYLKHYETFLNQN